jgi:hypothetical protein
MTQTIPDFSSAHFAQVEQMLAERYRKTVQVELAEAEIRLDADAEELTACPVMYWEARGAHFVVFRLAEQRFRGQFYYSEAQQYGTGREGFDTLHDCVQTLLQVQSDHERQMAGLRSGLTAVDALDGSYNGPTIV